MMTAYNNDADDDETDEENVSNFLADNDFVEKYDDDHHQNSGSKQLDGNNY